MFKYKVNLNQKNPKNLISPASYSEVDYMGKVTNRTSLTSRGWDLLTPWNDVSGKYSILQLYIGNNFISLLEIVSALNLINIGHSNNYFYTGNCFEKYNPKIYFGTVQTTSEDWNFDTDSARKNLAQGQQKSGSLLIQHVLYMLNKHIQNLFLNKKLLHQQHFVSLQLSILYLFYPVYQEHNRCYSYLLVALFRF